VLVGQFVSSAFILPIRKRHCRSACRSDLLP
jgi:hypothetical protein